MDISNKNNILITGFGPFRDHKINASWEAVKLLPSNIDRYNIIKIEIPVAYDHVETNIPVLWQKLEPILVIHVGVSAYTPKLALEKCANREGYTSLDCLGKKHPTGQVCCEGDDCILTELNLEEIMQDLDNCDVQSCISNNAGKYLCEFIYYTSLKIDRKRTLFVHVPPIDKPYSTEQVSDGLQRIIKSCLKQVTRNETESVMNKTAKRR